MQRKASPAIYGIIENLFAFAVTLMDFACWRRQMDGRGWRQVDERWVPGAPVSFRCPGQHIMFLVPTICIQGLRIFVNLIEFQWKLSRCDGNGDGDSGSNDACGGGSAVLISFCLYLARRQFLSSSVYGNRSYKVSSSSFLGKLWRKRYRYTDTADVELLLLSPSVLNSQHVPMLICFTSSTPPSSTTSCCAAHFLNRPNENVKLTAARDYVTFCTAANATDAAAATATEAAWTEWIMLPWKCCQNNSNSNSSRKRRKVSETRKILDHNFCMRHFQWRNCGKARLRQGQTFWERECLQRPAVGWCACTSDPVLRVCVRVLAM